MADENAAWSSRFMSLYPSARPPEPRLDTAGSRAVLRDRILAATFDIIVCLIFIEAPLLYLADAVTVGAFGDSSLFGLVVIGAVLPLTITYSFAFEWQYARTPGKVWRQLMTVSADGTACTGPESALRNIARYVDYLGIPPLVVGVVTAAMTENGERIGDRVAGTVVVRSG